jgi:hypothetical protein
MHSHSPSSASHSTSKASQLLPAAGSAHHPAGAKSEIHLYDASQLHSDSSLPLALIQPTGIPHGGIQLGPQGPGSEPLASSLPPSLRDSTVAYGPPSGAQAFQAGKEEFDMCARYGCTLTSSKSTCGQSGGSSGACLSHSKSPGVMTEHMLSSSVLSPCGPGSIIKGTPSSHSLSTNITPTYPTSKAVHGSSSNQQHTPQGTSIRSAESFQDPVVSQLRSERLVARAKSRSQQATLARSIHDRLSAHAQQLEDALAVLSHPPECTLSSPSPSCMGPHMACSTSGTMHMGTDARASLSSVVDATNKSVTAGSADGPFPEVSAQPSSHPMATSASPSPGPCHVPHQMHQGENCTGQETIKPNRIQPIMGNAAESINSSTLGAQDLSSAGSVHESRPCHTAIAWQQLQRNPCLKHDREHKQGVNQVQQVCHNQNRSCQNGRTKGTMSQHAQLAANTQHTADVKHMATKSFSSQQVTSTPSDGPNNPRTTAISLITKSPAQVSGSSVTLLPSTPLQGQRLAGRAEDARACQVLTGNSHSSAGPEAIPLVKQGCIEGLRRVRSNVNASTRSGGHSSQQKQGPLFPMSSTQQDACGSQDTWLGKKSETSCGSLKGTACESKPDALKMCADHAIDAEKAIASTGASSKCPDVHYPGAVTTHISAIGSSCAGAVECPDAPSTPKHIPCMSYGGHAICGTQNCAETPPDFPDKSSCPSAMVRSQHVTVGAPKDVPGSSHGSTIVLRSQHGTSIKPDHTSDNSHSSTVSGMAQMHPQHLRYYRRHLDMVSDEKGGVMRDGPPFQNTTSIANSMYNSGGRVSQVPATAAGGLQMSDGGHGMLQPKEAHMEIVDEMNLKDIILAAAHAQISADVAACEAARHLEQLDLLATGAEEAQTQLAAVHLEQEEDISRVGTHAEAASEESGAGLLLLEWQNAVEKAKTRLCDAHTSAASIREEALIKAQVSTHAVQEAATALAATSRFLSISAPMPLQPWTACQTALAAHTEVIDMVAGEHEAAEAMLCKLSERAAAARADAADALTQAEIAAGHKSDFQRAGQASDATAAESAARTLIHQSKQAHASEHQASSQCAVVQGRALAAQQQVLKLRKAGEAVRECLQRHDKAEQDPGQKDMHQQVVGAAADADLAFVVVGVHRGCLARLQASLGHLQEQHDAVTMKGDTYAADALQAQIKLTQARIAMAEESVKELQEVAEQQRISVASQREAELTQAEKAQSHCADLMQAASRLLKVVCVCTEWLKSHAAEMAMCVQCELEHTVRRASQLQYQAVEFESSAAAMLNREELSRARRAQEETTRMRSDAQVVRP